MKLLKLVPISILLVVGCKPATVYVDRPVEVKVMVPVPCPEPPKIARPTLKPLDPRATPQEVAEAALRAFIAMSGYAESLEVVLESYRKPVEKK